MSAPHETNGVFTFFVEPGSYTLDLARKVHEPLGIGYAFFKGRPKIAKAEEEVKAPVLAHMSPLKRIRFLWKVYRDNELVIFNGYNTVTFLLFFLATALGGGTRRLAVESDTQFKPPRGWKGILKNLYLKILFTRPFVLGFAGGRHTHMELFRHYGMAEDNLFLLPMVVDNEKFRPEGPRPEKPFVFLFVGRLIPLKRVDLLIESFLEAFGDDSGSELKIVGDGELKELFRKRYGHMRNVRFEGALHGEALVKAYQTSHVLVLPSEREQWGLVINEAMASGMPVIVSDRVGARFDLIDGRDTGLVFPDGKREELSRCMRRLHDDRALYKEMARNALELMQTEWNHALYARNLKKAIGSGRKRGERP